MPDVTGAVPDVTIAVVGICSAAHLDRCLAALGEQRGVGAVEIVAACDPRLPGLDAIRTRYPAVRVLTHPEVRAPTELAARAVAQARGAVIVLTEDHCVPGPGWVRALCDRLGDEVGAAGGPIEPPDDGGMVTWAFYFVDFFRYAPPVRGGPTPMLSVCNVAYRRRALAAVAAAWDDGFLEPHVHHALRRAVGPLVLVPAAAVRSGRHVRFADGVRERSAFGRLFGATRIAAAPRARRFAYAALAPALPFVLLVRMSRVALRTPALRGRFVRALPAIVPLLLAWSWGEWLGYLTARRPRSVETAPDARAAPALA